MSENNRSNDPAAKVERMNRIFDHVVLPMILFTVVMFAVSAMIFKPDSCGGKKKEELSAPEVNQQVLDAFLMREVLLEDMEANKAIFELGGYTVVETEQSGVVAYRQIDEETQIFENIADGTGGRYSAVMCEKDGLTVTVRVYSDTIFLVEAEKDGEKASAIFRDEHFASWTSGSDAYAAEVLEMVPAEQLCSMLEVYKESILSLIGDDQK